jgi:hypothetical protein
VLSELAMSSAGITSLMHTVAAGRTVSAPAQISLPGIPSSVPAARRFTAGALAGCPRVDDLVQAVGELASNAIGHSASGEGGTFADGGPALLPLGPRNGWGLGIVEAVTDRSGATVHVDGARTAWAEATWTS